MAKGKIPAGLAKYQASKRPGGTKAKGAAHPAMRANQFKKGGGRKGR